MPRQGSGSTLRRVARFGCAALASVAVLLSPLVTGARAQGPGELSRSYVNPFPEGDRYRILVLGDSLGDGIWSGLYRAFEKDQNVEVINKSRAGSGFARPGVYDWNEALKQILSEGKYHIAVIMLGVNDTQLMRTKEGAFKLGSDEWKDAYGARIEAFTRQLKDKGVAVYWVGVPIMRSPKQNEEMQILNEMFRERAFVNGVKFIDTWNGFADQFGRYSAFGPDMSGQVRRLRVDDGVHFTMRGYEKLAHFVEREIRRDLNFAKAERNIPLAGDEQEQERALGRRLAQQQNEESRNRLGKASPAKEPGQPSESEHVKKEDAAAAGAPAPENSSEKQKIAKVAGVEIIRPPLPEAALNAAQSLTPTNVAGSLPEGETIASEFEEGLTALATVSPVNEVPLLASRSRQPITERAYYRVLIKGEQLEPKEGRSDDFSWQQE